MVLQKEQTYTKKFPRKPTAFRRGMNWENYLIFFLIFNNFSIHRNIYCYFVTINIADYDFIQIQTIQNKEYKSLG